MPRQSPKRGAIPSPRHMLAGAVPYAELIEAPSNSIVKPNKISMWGNDIHGDCVTAEEAFAKACHSPEIFISDNEVIAWATRHGVLEGAYLLDVMTWMQNDGFAEDAVVYDDGPYFSVDWTNAGILQSAIYEGPVKLGIAANQIEDAWSTTGGQTGWFATGFQADDNEDHCVALCGYGAMSWLAQQLGVQVPAGVDGTHAGYAMFTWDSIGIIDVPSMIAITQEAWLRRPTTVTRPDGSAPTVAVASNGDQFVFWKGTDNNLWQAVKRGGGGWQGPTRPGMGPLGSNPDTGVDGSGATYVYWKGTDDNLWRGYWNGTKWAGPEEVPGMGPLG